MSVAPQSNSAAPQPPAPGSRPRPSAGLARLLKGPVSALHVLLISLVAVAVALLFCILLALNVLPGYPDSTEKNVPIYSQAGPNAPSLSLYLNPPLNALQASGETQLLAVQFTNHGNSSLNITGLDLSPESCFNLAPAAGTPSVPSSGNPVSLAAGRSSFFWYRLSAQSAPACLGQFPLVLRHSWKDSTAAKTDPDQQQSISTGPIHVSTRGRIRAERFFSLLAKMIPLILLPVVLAAGGYIFQLLQDQKARHQKELDDAHDTEVKKREARRARYQKLQEQKLEVWKTMIPGMVQAIRDHYVPIIRVLSLIQDDVKLPLDKADLHDILASALLFRTKITHMVDKNGGFYFRNHAGEDLCADLTNSLLDRFYTLSGDKQTFLKAAEKLEPGNSLTQARQFLRIDSPLPGPFAQLCTHFKAELAGEGVLAQLHAHTTFLRQILDHEINDPFYPFWYDSPPVPIQVDQLKKSITDLGLAEADQKELGDEFERYLASLPKDPPKSTD